MTAPTGYRPGSISQTTAAQVRTYAAMLKNEGLDGREIQKRLEQRGVPRDEAKAIVKALNRAGNARLRKRGLRRIVYGAVILAVGLAITIGTFLLAHSDAGTPVWVVAYGAMGLGAASILGGLIEVIAGMF